MDQINLSTHNITIIIGNGFDLSLGLKTSYMDFVKSPYYDGFGGKSCSKTSEFIDFEINKNDMSCNEGGLYAFVKNDVENKNWVDLEMEIADYCKFQKQYLIDKNVRQEINALRYFLYKYLQFEVMPQLSAINKWTDYAGCLFLRLLFEYGNGFKIWDFNYTSTCESILNNIYRNDDEYVGVIYYPHANIKDCNMNQTAKIIIGTEYDEDIMQICPAAIKANMIDNYASMKKEFQDNLSIAETLIIYGHSIGQSDSDYFKEALMDLSTLQRVFVISKDIDSVLRVKANIDKLSNGAFMKKHLRGEIDFYSFCTPEKFILDEKQRNDLDKLMKINLGQENSFQ